ncbi:MAG: prephenate dehydratase [Dehalococcoidia bacterium]|nr:prephenate dehydratase [Dehalococcoidia bacterium]
MSLRSIRQNIDNIDSEIVGLLAERMKLAHKIGQEKKKSGKSIEDRQRELQVLENVKTLAQKYGVSSEEMERLYCSILRVTKNVQGIEVAFQGQAGAYSQEAAFSFFGPSVPTRPFDSLDEVFSAVQEGIIPYGIVPVENSQEGSITRSYDLLLDHEVTVYGEVLYRVSHCLIANKGVRIDRVRKVYSHPQALGQCHRFLKKLGVEETVPAYDTAGSVKMVREQKIMDGAAIASARAAHIYDMKIIAREIEDNPQNTTRFFILSRQPSAPTGNDKTSIAVLLKHRPGTLYEALGEFARRKINLTKIESRPTRQKPWEYNFYLDFEGHCQDPAISQTLSRLEEISLFMKVLGSYSRAKQP